MKNELALTPAAGQPATMSSFDLLELINQSRALYDQSEVRRNQFHERIRDELDGDHYKTFVVGNQNGTESIGFLLTHEQCMLVSMRESKAVRRAVIDKLGSKKPAELSRMEILQIAMAAEQEKLIAIEQRDEAIRTKAHISDKKTATAMATASALSKKVSKLQDELGQNQLHATMIAVENATKRIFGNQGWRPLKKYCDENGIQPKDVADTRYGSVRAWPASAWKSVYDIVLEKVFPGSKTK